jgi:FkbM family methyltransferase
MLSSLLKPEYLYQPWRLIKRFISRRIPPHGKPADFVLSCGGLPLHVDSCDSISDAIATFGVYDLAVAEAIVRLTPVGGTAVDIGANVGAMSGAMVYAIAARKNIHGANGNLSGRVISIEPHPEIYANLERNAAVWRTLVNVDIRTLNVAVSDRQCSLELHFPKDRTDNNGMATLEARGNGQSEECVRVNCERLDDILPPGKIDCIKMDVEGHELSVLKGAETLLAERRAPHWIFEEHSMYPSPVSAHFEQRGYRVFYLKKCRSHLKLADPKSARASASEWEAPSFLATLDADRVRQLFGRRGWLALRRHAV